LVLCCGVISRLNREHKPEGTALKSTSCNQYWQTTGNSNATMCYVVATGEQNAM